MPVITSKQWDEFCSQFENVHILQSKTWGEFKSKFDWRPIHFAIDNAGAQVLLRKAPLGLSLAYIPRGPIGTNWDALWPEIHRYCRSKNVIFLKVEPNVWEKGSQVVMDDSFQKFPDGFRESGYNIQPRRTILIDLTKSVDELLKGMKQKTRYNIKLAQRKGVTVKHATNVDVFFSLLELTGKRDGFDVHSLSYYREVFTSFSASGQCRLLLADYDNKTIAGLMVFKNQKSAWYFYGASSDTHRDLMPNYLLQWEAMQWAKKQGCSVYDLWGIPDETEGNLEANYLTQKGDLWGVYRFKRGFGGEVTRTIGSWEWIYTPVWYQIYRFYLYLLGKKE